MHVPQTLIPRMFISCGFHTCLHVHVHAYCRFIHKNPEDPNEVPGGFWTDIAPVSRSFTTYYVVNEHLPVYLTFKDSALNA